ncbi:hypothetical protein GCM10028820_31480 [Tessaracoccus terricola]
MTPEQVALIHGLVHIGTPSAPRVSPEEFLKGWPADDGSALAAELLTSAIGNSDAYLVEAALTVAFTFGLSNTMVEPLSLLVGAHWHTAHEGVVRALTELADPASTGALWLATQIVPEYLQHNETRVLAVEAIHGLAAVDSPVARAALRSLVSNPDPNIQWALGHVGHRPNQGS